MTAHLKLELAPVVSTDDPHQLGRVQVQYDDGLISDWLAVASPFAGPGYGMFAQQITSASDQSPPVMHEATANGEASQSPPPEQPSTLALVAFATENRTYGYVIGFLFRWDKNVSTYVVDKAKQQSVWIVKTRNGKTITLDDSDDTPAVTISDEKENVIKIDTKKNEVSIVSKGDLTLTATKKLTLNGENIEISASKNVKIEGSQIDLNAPKG